MRINITKKKTIISFGLFIISLSLSYLYFSKIGRGGKSPISGDVLSATAENTPLPNPEDFEEEKNEKVLNILLLGYGGAGHQGGFLTDVIMLAHFDFEKNILGLISFPRDLWFEDNKINHLLSFSGGQIDASRIKSVISNISDMPIDYYIGIDFVGFQRAIGQDLSGITVNVPTTFEDSWYPIKGEELNPCSKSPEEIAELTRTRSGFALEKEFECRYEHLYFEAGLNQMEGGDALAYVRSRHSSSDFARSERQRVVLIGIRDRIFDLDSLSNTTKFFSSMNKHTSTDLNEEIIDYLLPLLSSADKLEKKSITLSTENVLQNNTSSGGQFILTPTNEWKSISQYISQELN